MVGLLESAYCKTLSWHYMPVSGDALLQDHHVSMSRMSQWEEWYFLDFAIVL